MNTQKKTLNLDKQGQAADCIEQSPLAQFTVDRGGNLLYCNQRYRTLFGESVD